MGQNEVILTVDSLSKEFDKEGEVFHALDDVSFQLKKGEILGVIGRNGSGKSTLLKVLSKITGLTKGEIRYEGVLTSIIDIGTGFHPDLSGKENVFLSASILGLNKTQVQKVYDQIVIFSGLDDFMKMPVKTFSSGMYLRLAFSIAFHSKIDILLLDEVLAVGDADFRRKCYDKIRELKECGTSIIIVSHQMEPIIEFCDQCIWLDNGKTLQKGMPIEVIESYSESILNDSTKIRGVKNNPKVIHSDISVLNNSFLEVTKIEVKAKSKSLVEDIFMDDTIEVTLFCNKLVANKSIEFIFSVYSVNGTRVLADSYCLRNDYKAELSDKGNYKINCEIPPNLLNRGVYSLGITVAKNGEDFINEANDIYRFKVYPRNRSKFDMQISAIIKPILSWEVTKVDN